MKRSVPWLFARLLLAMLSVAGPAQAGLTAAGSVGPGHGVQLPCPDYVLCYGEYLLNYDGSAENGYCWQYGGLVSPDYGAFAECFSAFGWPCEIDLFLTGQGNACEDQIDLYLWDDAGGTPGNVLSVFRGEAPCPVAVWPNVNCLYAPLYPVRVDGAFWAGFAARPSDQASGFFIAADTDGPGGCPFTRIAPGVGYPTGWQDVSVVWGPTRSLGIAVRVEGDPPHTACCRQDGTCAMSYGYCDNGIQLPGVNCDANPCPMPVRHSSWGRVKTAYR
jgi:hypothetical protein